LKTRKLKDTRRRRAPERGEGIIPIILFDMNVSFENNGHGIIPDHIIRNSIDDEIHGIDAVMEYAKKLR